MGKIFVESEFAPLKRVILSCSESTICKMWMADSYSVADLIRQGKLRGDEEFYFFEDYEERLQKMSHERDALRSILERYGVEVLMPRTLTDKEKASALLPGGPTNGEGISNMFARDPICVIGNHAIAMNIKRGYRRHEFALMEHILANTDCVHMPPIGGFQDGVHKGPFLEGGDILVYHKTVFVGNSGYASDEEGIAWLRDYLKNDDYEVYEVGLVGNVLHLDCAISLVREGLMIVCPELLKDGIPEVLSGWDRIVVEVEDAMKLAVNGMAINENVYLTDIAFRDTIGKQLEQHGIIVEYADLEVTRAHFGSVRCTLNPLLR